MDKRRKRSYFDTDHLERDIGRRTVRGGAITAVAQVGKSLLEIGSTVLLARLLTPADFGLIGMVIAVTAFLTMFKDLGLSMATIQRKDIDHAQVSALFWINVALSAAIMLVTAALAPFLAWFYDEPRLVGITLGLAVGFIFGGLTVQHEALLRRHMRFGAIALIEFASLAISLGLAVLMAMWGWEYKALVAKHVIAAAVSMVGVWIACSWRPGWWRRGTDVGSMLRFGGHLTGFNFVNYFARNFDDVLIGRVAGAEPLGLYQKAYEILMVPLKQINTPVGAVAIPALSRLVGDAARYRAAYLRILEKALMVTMPLGALLIVGADWIVLLVLGDQWIEASRIFAMFGILTFSQPIGNATGWLFISQDRTADMFRWGIVGSTLAVLSFLVGMPWGALGVAGSYAISGLLIRTPIVLWYAGRVGPVSARDIYARSAPFFVAGLVAMAATYGMRRLWLPPGPAVGIAVALVVTAITNGLTLTLFASGRKALIDAAVIGRRLLVKGKQR